MVQPFEQQNGDQGCPNLNAQGVFAGTDESLQLEVLLKGLKEKLDLPAVFVDDGDRCGGFRCERPGVPICYGETCPSPQPIRSNGDTIQAT